MNYRKIWKERYGEIPVDSKGRIYEIHHIDGNRNNNVLENLIAVSIEEHFNIHLEQGDYEAATLIASRLGLSEEELNSIRLRGVSKPLVKCPHCSKIGGKPQMMQWHFDNCKSTDNKRTVRARYNCKKCGKIVGGKGNLLQHERSCGISKDRNISKFKTNDSLVCPHCNFEGKPHSNMKRFHFDNCTAFTKEKRVLKVNQVERVYTKKRGRPKKQT